MIHSITTQLDNGYNVAQLISPDDLPVGNGYQSTYNDNGVIKLVAKKAEELPTGNGLTNSAIVNGYNTLAVVFVDDVLTPSNLEYLINGYNAVIVQDISNIESSGTGLQHTVIINGSNVFAIAGLLSLWTPEELANLSIWLDGADASTITLNGSNVSQWDDKSGNDNHFAQSNTSYQPLYVPTNINGKPSIEFSNIDYLKSIASINTTQPFTIYNVLYPKDNSYPVYSSFYREDGSLQIDLFLENDKYLSFAGSNLNSGVNINQNTPVILGCTFNGSNSEIIVNESTTTGDAGINNLDDFVSIGNTAGNSANIGYHESLLIDGILSSEDKDKLFSYLQNKWGIS